MLKLFILFLFIQNLSADDIASKLYGTWQSDRDLTSKYLNKYAKLTGYQKEVLPKFFGNSVVIFDPEGIGVIKIKEVIIPKFKNHEEMIFPAVEIKFTYEILGETESQVVIKDTSKEGVLTDIPFSIMKFEDDDTYSISISNGVSDINGREFFKRIKSVGSELIK